MKQELKFNGQTVKSITYTPSVVNENHSHSMLINGHLIRGINKGDCIDYFYANPEKFDNSFRNSVQHFVNI